MNMRIKEFCNGTVRDFAMALRARKVSGAFEKQAPGAIFTAICRRDIAGVSNMFET